MQQPVRDSDWFCPSQITLLDLPSTTPHAKVVLPYNFSTLSPAEQREFLGTLD